MVKVNIGAQEVVTEEVTPLGSGAAGSFVLPAGTVGFFLTDVEGSTRLWEADADAIAVAMARPPRSLTRRCRAMGDVPAGAGRR
jgi:hypothetical protein